MAYLPSHRADVFISYAHADDFGWIERLKVELENALTRRLRASIKPEIFLDSEDLRAGRVFDRDIPECLNATGFFLAIVSQRYNTSTYCRHKELGHFLKYNPPESGRTIQIQLDLSAALPLPKPLAVPFATAKGPLKPSSEEYKESLRRVYEPIVHELDRLYAQSKMVFLAWPADAQLQEERQRLQSEIEGRGLRSYPEAIGEYQDDIHFREALQESAASVHFFGIEADRFAERQFGLALQIGKPTIVASRKRDEFRSGPSSPVPIWLDQGNPTIAIANALDTVLGRGPRDERTLSSGLGKARLFLVFKSDVDHTLGLRLRQRIVNHGPFEVLEPKRDSLLSTRYDDLAGARAAVLCWGNVAKDWIEGELDALNSATVSGQLHDLKRAIYLKSPNLGGIDLIEGDHILQSDADLDSFLSELAP
jgi:TIR domain